ncbi:7,8-didemethyl-8-hydroxy-5-deazariboflavin synthase subunit CofG [Chroococcidiopsis sp. FACHB-1243]|uniref:7,8-didemethyl-8-hydroxy-5-deazariboflavin synthase subunit CofG n=1 Tax=Chroococcidiopsis sp. [FACHB-1243] TaxID=2692781 RepID=UPI00178433A3|nr:7,8-didemethyl-8-hydroxy-5-deazariboflavin synthase subunit CofG [Chroococcidiopsis sp. [FACHB-1243]]MBD2307186.1 7,8-didemethyl-8-hydroxy-5-deazariboflavin synthase subunit CofG [Chroococcidiopsis sp. [FACHB-1243]]
MTDIVTYSPAYTLVPTYECFNRCSYCNFRTAPGQSPWMTLETAAKILRGLQKQGVCEILILSGEVHPRSPRRNAWFDRIYQLCQLALELGFLPHTNAGPLSFTEMKRLKTVNVSMGLMLEQLTPELLKTVHRHAPSKIPQLRMQQLEWAGKLQIPFTTGLLLGIGETETDWWDTLEAIALLHQRWGHIQEVILQPHSPGSQQSFDAPAFNPHQLPEVITQAREILPSEITIQIPPNLVLDPQWLLACIEAGARDLGGISPKDEVNPDYPHLSAPKLIKILEPAGWQLVPRLPVYSQYDNWLTPQLQTSVKQWRTTSPQLFVE